MVYTASQIRQIWLCASQYIPISTAKLLTEVVAYRLQYHTNRFYLQQADVAYSGHLYILFYLSNSCCSPATKQGRQCISGGEYNVVCSAA